ncbi:MAG TPA: carbohydrate ABC transporter permease [Spirochaetia bacterium]|nr:carbohydrate ABC transporter permease [Spirochaetia bacterium]
MRAPDRPRQRARVAIVARTTTSYVLLIFLCALFLMPFIWMLGTSLKPDSEVTRVPLTLLGSRIEWKNYERMWNTFPFGRTIINGLIVATLGTLLCLASSGLAAYAFSKLHFRGRDRLFLLYLATLMIPQQALVIPLFLLMNALKWVNTYQAMILPWAFNAFGTFMLRQFFMSVPGEFSEAALMEGAGHFSILARIVAPLATAGFATLTVFTFIMYWNNFLWPMIIASRPEMFTFPVGLGVFQGQFGTVWNLMMAGAALSVVPAILIYALSQRYIVGGLTISGLGGR